MSLKICFCHASLNRLYPSFCVSSFIMNVSIWPKTKFNFETPCKRVPRNFTWFDKFLFVWSDYIQRTCAFSHLLVTSFVQIATKFRRHMNTNEHLFCRLLVASRWPRIVVALTVSDSYLNRRDFQWNVCPIKIYNRIQYDIGWTFNYVLK